MIRRYPFTIILLILTVLFCFVLLAACDNDRGARQDLPNSSQNLVESEVEVYLHPDQFPNVTHRCDDTTGIWTTTDRAVWIVYGDPLCGGTSRITVLDNIPGGVGTAASTEG